MTIQHLCAKYGCSNLVPKGQRYCEEHTKMLASKTMFCKHPGCPEKVLITEKYCEKHKFTKKYYDKKYDKKRGNSSERGYSSRWARVSRQFLIDNPVCSRCKVAPAVLVHHIKPIRAGGEIFEPDNLVGLCASCHAIIHAEISTR